MANPRGSSRALFARPLHLPHPSPLLSCIVIDARIIYIYPAHLPNPCGTDEPSVKNLPIPTHTIWCAQEVDTNLVSRYLTVAARASLGITSYRTFPSGSHFNFQVSVWGLTKTFLVMSLLSFCKKYQCNSKSKPTYFMIDTIKKQNTAWIWPTIGSIKIFKHFYGERRSWFWLWLQYSYEARFTMSTYLCIQCAQSFALEHYFAGSLFEKYINRNATKGVF